MNRPQTAPRPLSSPPGTSRSVLGICLLLALLVLFVYGQTLRFAFLNFDDDTYVVDNVHVRQGLTWDNVRWAMVAGASGDEDGTYYWMPLSLLSHMADVTVLGMDAGRHHAENMLLHAVSAILLFLILRSMTRAFWRSAFVAALFAVHPLRVESVAWIAERKDVLGALFFMLTLGAYLRYVWAPSAGRSLLVMLPFVLGLMSKPIMVSEPLLLLVLDAWPLGRLRSRADFLPRLREKVPLLLLSALSCAVTVLSHHQITDPGRQQDLLTRVGNAAVALCHYPLATLWPSGLAVFYPRPLAGWPLWESLGCLLLLALVTFLLLRRPHSRPWFAVGWLWYLLLIAPFSGVIQVGDQAWADRFTYLPQIGLLLALVWTVAEWASGNKVRRLSAVLLGVLAILLLSLAARRQTATWRDSLTLWERALAMGCEAPMVWNGYAATLITEGRYDEAKPYVIKTMAASPRHAEGHVNLGAILIREGRFREGAAEERAALAMEPFNPTAHAQLGSALCFLGDPAQGISEYRKALLTAPTLYPVRGALIHALRTTGREEEALRESLAALRINPGDAAIRYGLANLYQKLGRAREAALAFAEAERTDSANPRLLNDYAWMMATSPVGSVRDGRRAVELALEAEKLTGGKDAGVLDTLAAAYAESGDFAKATATAQRAMELAQGQGNKELERSLRAELKLYGGRKPVREGK